MNKLNKMPKTASERRQVEREEPMSKNRPTGHAKGGRTRRRAVLRLGTAPWSSPTIFPLPSMLIVALA